MRVDRESTHSAAEHRAHPVVKALRRLSDAAAQMPRGKRYRSSYGQQDEVLQRFSMIQAALQGMGLSV